jgi:hypothetical protein
VIKKQHGSVEYKNFFLFLFSHCHVFLNGW